MSIPVSGSMVKSCDPRPCKEYWILALTPMSASVASTFNSTLLIGKSSGTDVMYTACRQNKDKTKNEILSLACNGIIKVC